MDAYLPGIMSVIYSNVSPVDAIAQIEGQPAWVFWEEELRSLVNLDLVGCVAVANAPNQSITVYDSARKTKSFFPIGISYALV